MTQEQFVAVIKQVVFDPAVSEMVLQPAGREPHQVPVRMWDWYTGLPGPDKAMVQHAMRIAAYGAIFHFFAALDGSAAIDDPAARPAAAHLPHPGRRRSAPQPHRPGQRSGRRRTARTLDRGGIPLHRAAARMTPQASLDGPASPQERRQGHRRKGGTASSTRTCARLTPTR